MTRQTGNIRRVAPGRNLSTGAAVLDHPENDVPVTHGNDRLQKEVLRLLEASRAGRLSERGRAEQFEGPRPATGRGLERAYSTPSCCQSERVIAFSHRSAGQDRRIDCPDLQGDHEKMKQAVNNVALVLQALQKNGAADRHRSEGQLSERGKPEQFQGAYAEIVKGVNAMLDAILLPIGEGNRILAQISSGKIDELIAQTYKGDHEKMKLAVNNVAVVLQRPAEGDWRG